MARYYEEFTVGERFESPARTVTEHDVYSFAGLSGDYNQVHTDREFASGTALGKPIAHGILGIAIAGGLVTRTGIFDGTTIALLSIKEWKFLGPIYFGDTIHIEFEITMMRETSKPDTGIMERLMRVVNQRGETVQSGEMVTMVRRRPSVSGG